MKLQFYKYRTTHSSGPGNWAYVEVNKEYAKEYFDDMTREWNWSEHFRGIEYKKIKSPPKEWFEGKIIESKNLIFSHKNKVNRYKKILYNL